MSTCPYKRTDFPDELSSRTVFFVLFFLKTPKTISYGIILSTCSIKRNILQCTYFIFAYHGNRLPWQPLLVKERGCLESHGVFFRPQPSLSCSFDGSLKSENGDSEPKWPELPPILNQNEDRRRNKYLRKDYLKVHIRRFTHTHDDENWDLHKSSKIPDFFTNSSPKKSRSKFYFFKNSLKLA